MAVRSIDEFSFDVLKSLFLANREALFDEIKLLRKEVGQLKNQVDDEGLNINALFYGNIEDL